MNATQPTANDVTSTLFQDAMDPSRFVRIKTEKQNTVLCKIYFGKSKTDLIYHGVTELPKSLFYFDGGTRIGFNPARDPEDPRIAKLREEAKRSRRRDDRDDD